LSNQNSFTLKPDLWLDEYGGELYHFAFCRLGNVSTAEEMVQEALLAALKSKDSFSGKSTEKTWLFSILKHKIIDFYRKKKIEKNESDMDVDDIGEFFDEKGMWKKMPQSWGDHPEKALEKKEFWKVFQQCLHRLPDRLLQVYTMREIEEMDNKEICKQLDLSSSNIWVILHRTRLKLRNCLEKNWFNTGGEDA